MGKDTPLPAARQNAFTLERWFFALSLVLFHGAVLWGRDPFWPVGGHAVVSAFFILSGYLTFQSFFAALPPAGAGKETAGKAFPAHTRAFYLRRVRRIMGPYWGMLLIMVALGALLTTLPPRHFLLSAHTWRYVAANAAFLNFLEPTLPGVFEGNAQPWMNPSLWTLKVELGFYLVLPLIAAAARRWGVALTAAGLYASGAAWFEACGLLHGETGAALWTFLQRQLPGQFMYFAAGILAFRHRALLVRKAAAVLPAAAAGWLLCVLFYSLRPLEPLFMAAVLTAAAHLSRRAIALSNRLPDHTYHLFLYHAPLLQTAWALGLPERLGFGPALLLTLVAAVAVTEAAISVPRLARRFFARASSCKGK